MTMQVASCVDAMPWVASVYFVEHSGKYYWLSEPHRRHSKELAENPNCAIAIVIKEDMPVLGLQAEGTARIINDIKVISKIMPKYVKKYGAGKQFLARAKKGINKHKLYEFTPKNVIVFDENDKGP